MSFVNTAPYNKIPCLLPGPDTEMLCTVREGSRHLEESNEPGLCVTRDRSSYSSFSSSVWGRTLSSTRMISFLSQAGPVLHKQNPGIATLRCPSARVASRRILENRVSVTELNYKPLTSTYISSIGSATAPPSTPECWSGAPLEICR